MSTVFLCDIHIGDMKCHIGKSVKVISSAPERWDEWDPADLSRKCVCTTHQGKLLHWGGEKLKRVCLHWIKARDEFVKVHPYQLASCTLLFSELVFMLMISQSIQDVSVPKTLHKICCCQMIKGFFLKKFSSIILFYFILFTPSSSLSGFLGGFCTEMPIAWFRYQKWETIYSLGCFHGTTDPLTKPFKNVFL